MLLLLLLAACADGKNAPADTDTAPPTETLPDRDGDGADDSADCAPDDPAIFPGADEFCNGVDDDCDALTDEAGAADAAAWRPDSDGDGAGDPEIVRMACAQPAGHVADGPDQQADCDDGDASVFPGAPEVCDGADNDCDGLTDLDDPDNDPAGTIARYADADGDGWGSGDPVAYCEAPEGSAEIGGDCDDSDPDTHPAAPEYCDGADDDCDGAIDDDPADPGTFWIDADGDSFGDPAQPVEACEKPPGASINYGDCDDADALNNPAAQEFCDGLDTDCDGGVDDNAVDAFDVWEDKDGDGWGDPAAARRACAQPAGTALNGDDRDDNDSGVHPGGAEICSDGIDQDCDGADAGC